MLPPNPPIFLLAVILTRVTLMLRENMAITNPQSIKYSKEDFGNCCVLKLNLAFPL